MDALTLDASAVIGLLDPHDAHHEDTVAALEASPHERFLLSTSAFAEVLVDAAARGRAREVERQLEHLDVRLVDVDAGVARRAAGLRGRHPSLRLPDAFVLATAAELEAELLTFDRRLARIAKQELA